MASMPVYYIDSNGNYYIDSNGNYYIATINDDYSSRLKYGVYIGNKKYKAVVKTANGIVAVQPFVFKIYNLVSKDGYILLDKNNYYLNLRG